ncbi:MAG: aldose 1-epimerase family protein [Nocardioidaceae bacterium]
MLQAGGYAATVTQVGATLRELTYQRSELIRGFAPSEMMPLYRGAVLAPWPNRISDGRYNFGGERHQLALNEPERASALHGLVAFAEWRMVDRSHSRLTMANRLWPQPGYPFHLDLEMSYALSAEGLTWRLTATNGGTQAAPYGCSIHPYFVAGGGRVDDWKLELPAREYLDVDEMLLRPREVQSVEGSTFDFRTPRTIGAIQIDNAYTGLSFDDSGYAVARLRHHDGHGVELQWDRSCPWVQVHTADRPEPEVDRVALAMEPMTCPPDAFRTGTDLITLAPGDSRTVEWSVRALS